jgi:peptidoglycan/xylan/chitin deacetylase (PgdA/CDA1 family)
LVAFDIEPPDRSGSIDLQGDEERMKFILLLRQLNIGHKAVFSTPACKAQNTAMLAVLRGFATQQDGVLDGATVQGLAVGAISSSDEKQAGVSRFPAGILAALMRRPIAGAIALALAALICAVGLLQGCSAKPVPAPEPVSGESEPADPVPPPEPERYTVELDIAAYPDAVVSPASIENEKGVPVAHLPYALLEGMRFAGWWTGPAEDPAAVYVDNASLGLLGAETDARLYARFEPKPKGIDHNVNGLPVLMYHYFYDPEQGETGADGNWMNIHEFESHLAYFKENNYYFPDWEEVDAYIRGDIILPEHSVVLTSDDGDESFYRLAAPLVKQYDAKITAFVIGVYFDPSVMKSVDPESVSFQSHSFDMHRGGSGGGPRLLSATTDEIASDVQQGDALLGTKMVFCYPYGKFDEKAKKTLSENGVRLAFAIKNARAYPMMDPMELPRVRMSDGGTPEGFRWQVR